MIFLMILLIAAVLLFPYGWVLFHRYRMVKRLKHKAEKLGFSWKPLRRGFLLSRNLSSKYDLFIEGDRGVYLVKLWACHRRGTTLVIDEEGRILEGRRYRLPLERNESAEADRIRWKYSRRRRVPKTTLGKLETTEKKVVFVLLNYPTYDRIVRKGKGQEVPIMNGSTLFGKIFYTPSAFENELLRTSRSDEIVI